jgi:pimeloyl-ACP methyl ester carboxylesterase
VETNGISMHVAEAGSDKNDKPAILFVHGFPELWYSWRHQMEHLAARGYRCVAPDLRGYGGTTAPPEVSASSTRSASATYARRPAPTCSSDTVARTTHHLPASSSFSSFRAIVKLAV